MRSEQVQWLIAVGQTDATTLPELEETNKTLSAMFFFLCNKVQTDSKSNQSSQPVLHKL